MQSIRLRVLGRAVVERDGTLVRGRSVQSHHLALLALLAVSPGRTASRERLIGWLWPERDTGRARHRLSVALHAIRRELGHDAILSSGDSVALNPSVVWTDVSAFLGAVESGRLEEAVQLSQGPFLDGFYLKDGGEFERWAEGERNRLTGLCRSSLERLADEAQGSADLLALEEWRRRLTVLAPYDSSLAVALMNVLVAKGDVAGAIAHARAYATRVEADLGIPVNPAVLDLARELTESAQNRRALVPLPVESAVLATPDVSKPPATAPPKSRRRVGRLAALGAAGVMAASAVWSVTPKGVASPGAELPSVVVFPFAEVGDAEDMGKALAREVGATLAIVPNLRVREAGAAGTAAPGGDRWRRVAREVRAAKAITGIVRTEGLRAKVTFQLRDVRTGETAWEATEQRELRSTDALVEALSMAIADDLRTRLARYIPHHYTDNERANDSFLKGVYEHRKADAERTWVALQHYRGAWQEDPEFALAHAIAGSAYMALSQNLGLSPQIGWEQGREHVMRAIEIDPTLPEAYSVLGRLQLWWDRDYEAAEATLRRAIMLNPMHPDARTWYAYYELYYLNDFDGAIANIRRALELDPLNTGRSRDVEVVLMQSRHFEEVLAQHRHTQAIDEDVATNLLNYRVANAYRDMGRNEEAVAEYLSVHEALGGPLPPGLGVTYVHMGRDEEAKAILRGIEQAAGPGGATGTGVALLYAELGDKDRAFELLGRALDANPPNLFHLKTHAAFDLLRSDPRYDELLERLGFPLD